MNTLANKPWYQERWPWLLAIMPVTAIVASGITVWFAVTSSDGLVVDDYYKQGRAINQTKARDQMAHTLGINALLTPQASNIQLQLDGKLQTPPGQLTLMLMHPTRSGDDHAIPLQWNGASYVGKLPRLSSARYRVQLTPEFGNWRLTGAWQPGTTLALTPAHST